MTPPSAAHSHGGFPGRGLAKGLAVTLRTMTKRTVTAQYPEVQPDLPPRSRGVIALLEENCTVCMLCARECPDWCIYIDSHKETLPAVDPHARARTRNVLDRFGIDFSLCMYCGICIEVCPFDALFWSPEFEYAETDIHELTHERDRLREWMWTVPAPPALDASAEEPKEIAAARKSADKIAAQAAAAAPAPAPAPAPGPAPAPAPDSAPAPGADPVPSSTVGASPSSGVALPKNSDESSDAGPTPPPPGEEPAP